MLESDTSNVSLARVNIIVVAVVVGVAVVVTLLSYGTRRASERATERVQASQRAAVEGERKISES